MEDIFCTYIHRKPSGETFYVGKGSMRFCRYRTKSSRSLHWRNIVNKYGFVPIIVCQTTSEKFALDLEKYLITSFRYLGSNLVNVLDGGELPTGNKHTDEFKLRKSIDMTGVAMDQSVKDKIRIAMSGKRKTDEHKKKLSMSKIGTKVPSAWKKVRCINTGEIFESLSMTAEKTKLDKSHISKCCLGKIKSIHGYSFEYIT